LVLDAPILLPDGCGLLTLQDAADYIDGLPLAERDGPDRRLAQEALVIAAERDGQVAMAWAAVFGDTERTQPDGTGTA
jgi:hypothetical protein